MARIKCLSVVLKLGYEVTEGVHEENTEMYC